MPKSLVERLSDEVPGSVLTWGKGWYGEQDAIQEARRVMKCQDDEVLSRLNLADAESGQLISIHARRNIVEAAASPELQATYSDRDVTIITVDQKNNDYASLYAGPAAPAMAFRLIDKLLLGE